MDNTAVFPWQLATAWIRGEHNVGFFFSLMRQTGSFCLSTCVPGSLCLPSACLLSLGRYQGGWGRQREAEGYDCSSSVSSVLVWDGKLLLCAVVWNMLAKSKKKNRLVICTTDDMSRWPSPNLYEQEQDTLSWSLSCYLLLHSHLSVLLRTVCNVLEEDRLFIWKVLHTNSLKLKLW